MLIGKEKIVTSNYIGLIQPVLIILSLGVFFFILDWKDIWAYITGLYISFIISLIISYIYVIKLVGPLKIISAGEFFKIIQEMFRYGILNQVAHITQMMSFRMSFYFLDRFHGESAVGVYSNGISLAESVWLIAKSISLVQYSRIANSNDRNYSQKLTVQLSKASAFLSLIILIPLVLFPSSFYEIIFGSGFSGVKEVIWSLSLGVIIYNFSILLGHYFTGTGRYHINAIASSAGLVVSLILFFTLIPRYDITGAGIATSVSYLFTTIILLIIFIKDNPANFRNSLKMKGDYKNLKKEISAIFKA